MKYTYLMKLYPQLFCKLNGDIFSKKKKACVLSCCRSMVCSQCLIVLKQLDECPICIQTINKESICQEENNKESTIIFNENDNNLKCANFEVCGWEGSLKKLIKHLEKDCKNQCLNNNCDFRGNLKELQQHFIKCTLKTEKNCSVISNLNSQTQLMNQAQNIEKVIQKDNSKISSGENIIRRNSYQMKSYRNKFDIINNISQIEIPNEKEQLSLKSEADEKNLEQNNKYKMVTKKLQENKRSFFLLYFLSLFCYTRILMIVFDFNYYFTAQFDTQKGQQALLAFIIIEILFTVIKILFFYSNSYFFYIYYQFFNISSAIYNFNYYLESHLQNGSVFVLRVSLIFGLMDGLFGILYDIPIFITVIVNNFKTQKDGNQNLVAIIILLHIIQIIINALYISSMVCDFLIGEDSQGNQAFSTFLSHRTINNIILFIIDLIYAFNVYKESFMPIVILSTLGFIMTNIFEQFFWIRGEENKNIISKSQWIKFDQLMNLDYFQLILWDFTIILTDQIDKNHSQNAINQIQISLTFIHILNAFFEIVVRPIIFRLYAKNFPKLQYSRSFKIDDGPFVKSQNQILNLIHVNQDIQIQFK